MEEPVSDAVLRRIIVDCLRSGVLAFSRHAREEIANDGLVEQDVRNTLRAGRHDGCDHERGSWRYRVRTDRIVVVVAIRSESSLVVVTAWRES